MNLIEALSQAEHQKRRGAWASYREMLQRNDPKDADAMRGVMNTLGVNADQLKRDLAAVEEVTTLEAHIQGVDDGELTMQIEQAAATLAAYRQVSETIAEERKAVEAQTLETCRQESERIANERRAEESRLSSVLEELRALLTRAGAGRERLAQLKGNNPRLFATPRADTET